MEAIKFVFGDLELTDEVINRLAQLGYTPESLKKAIKAHEWKYPSDEPALYCGTYGRRSFVYLGVEYAITACLGQKNRYINI